MQIVEANKTCLSAGKEAFVVKAVAAGQGPHPTRLAFVVELVKADRTLLRLEISWQEELPKGAFLSLVPPLSKGLALKRTGSHPLNALPRNPITPVLFKRTVE